MQIAAPCVVSLVWRLTDAQNEPIDELEEPVEFFYGGDDLLAKVEEALDGQEAGFETDLQLEPESAFGEYRPERVCFESRSIFPEQLEEGMQFDGLPEGSTTVGMPTDLIYTVTEIYPEHVVLDGNHPLAGIALRLHMKVTAVRDATGEELAAGSVSESPLSVLPAPPPSAGLH